MLDHPKRSNITIENEGGKGVYVCVCVCVCVFNPRLQHTFPDNTNYFAHYTLPGPISTIVSGAARLISKSVIVKAEFFTTL